MQCLFTVHGIQEKVPTDNGRQFANRKFQQFAEDWNFAHVMSSPCYNQSIGQVENAVKQAKQLPEKCNRNGSDLMLGLLNPRNIPRDDTIGSPAQCLLSRRMHTMLSTLPKAKLLVLRLLNTKQVSSQSEAEITTEEIL